MSETKIEMMESIMEITDIAMQTSDLRNVDDVDILMGLFSILCSTYFVFKQTQNQLQIIKIRTQHTIPDKRFAPLYLCFASTLLFYSCNQNQLHNYCEQIRH